MKSSLIWLPAAVVLGGLVGYYGPAGDIRALKEAQTEAEAAPARRASRGFDSFAEIANIPREARRPRRRERTAEPATTPTNDVGQAEATPQPRRRFERASFNPEDLRARIDEASELWRTRTTLKRAAAITNLGLDDKGAEAFDRVVAEMNDHLRESMQALAERLAGSDEGLTPELGVRLMGDLAASVAEAYDAMGTVVGDAQRGEVSQMMLFEFVDPSAAEPLIAVQDKLEGSILPIGGSRR